VLQSRRREDACFDISDLNISRTNLPDGKRKYRNRQHAMLPVRATSTMRLHAQSAICAFILFDGQAGICLTSSKSAHTVK